MANKFMLSAIKGRIFKNMEVLEDEVHKELGKINLGEVNSEEEALDLFNEGGQRLSLDDLHSEKAIIVDVYVESGKRDRRGFTILWSLWVVVTGYYVVPGSCDYCYKYDIVSDII